MSRIFAAILLVVALAVGGGIIATAAYQAGVNTAVTTGAATGGGSVVAPVVVPAYGYGIGWWHPFGWIFGFFATLFFLFIVFALIRAIFFRGGPGRRGGWGPGWGGWYSDGPNGGATGPGPRNGWESRAHGTFDDWHRRAHEPGADPTAGAGSQAPTAANPADATSRTPTPPAGPFGTA